MQHKLNAFFEKKQDTPVADQSMHNGSTPVMEKNPSAFTMPNEPERAILCSLLSKANDAEAEISMAELARLVETAGGIAVATLTQLKEAPDARTYFGSGKIVQLKELCHTQDCTLAVVDGELTPSQIRNMEQELDGPRVIDRSMLILDIFAAHATSAAGKLQVELAQLQYTIPRLGGQGTDLSRLGGGIGTRGPGESKLETDRRHLHRRIDALRAQLDELDRTRQTQRRARTRSGIPQIAIAGYTNAGKSTLLNALTDAGILAQDKLFATLDPTTRKCMLSDGTQILLTDTVGFIRNLPHHLIRAFRSTLEEVCYADMLLIILDASDPQCNEHLRVTRELLQELGAAEKPVLYVLNKIDCVQKSAFSALSPDEDTVAISALHKEGLQTLEAKILSRLRRGRETVVLRFPMEQAALVHRLHTQATVKATQYDAQGIVVVAEMEQAALGRFAPYITDRFSGHA